jgi:hypothetical protein
MKLSHLLVTGPLVFDATKEFFKEGLTITSIIKLLTALSIIIDDERSLSGTKALIGLIIIETIYNFYKKPNDLITIINNLAVIGGLLLIKDEKSSPNAKKMYY